MSLRRCWSRACKSYPQPVEGACAVALAVLLWLSDLNNPQEEDNMHLAIAGNIGSGKTTLTTLLAKHYRYTPHFEQVDDNPYLNDFYKDMQRWSFNLQVYFLRLSFVQLLLRLRKHFDLSLLLHHHYQVNPKMIHYTPE